MVQMTVLPGERDDHVSRRLRPHEWLDSDERQLRAAALELALAHGAAPDPDSITVVLSARAWCDEFRPGVWTAEIVRQLLWLDVGTWCAEFDVEPPADVPLALWAVVQALHATSRLGADSDGPGALVAPLVDSGGFRPPDARRRRRGAAAS